MGRLVDSITDFWEGLGGFLALGSRHLLGKCAIFARGFRVRSYERSITERLARFGRKAWQKRVPAIQSIQYSEKIDALEQTIAGKEEAAEEVRARIADLRERRENHVIHYQKKINEQLKLKQPVEAEHTNLLVEIKRISKELNDTNQMQSSLASKTEVQKKRLEGLVKAGEEDEAERYLREELSQEVDYNEQTLALKRQKCLFLERKKGEYEQRAEKIKKVIEQYDRQINELRANQRDGTERIDKSIDEMQTTLHRIQKDIKSIEAGLGPLFGELGAELRRRGCHEASLAEEDAEMDRLEAKRDEQLREISRLRSDSASIGWGVKLGFYGLLLALIVGIVALIIVLI